METADTAHVAHITSLISTLLTQFLFPHFSYLSPFPNSHFPNPFPLFPNPLPSFLFISPSLYPLVCHYFIPNPHDFPIPFPFLFLLLSLKNFPPLHSSLIQNSFLFVHRYFNISFPFLLLVPPHRKKRLTNFPSPAGMSLTKLILDRNNSVMTSLFLPRESLVVTSRLGTGNSRTFFYGAPLFTYHLPSISTVPLSSYTIPST